jgi:hypothetical protein
MVEKGLGVALELIVEALNFGGGEVKKLIKERMVLRGLIKDARIEEELEPSSLLPVKPQHLIHRLGIDLAQGGHSLVESLGNSYFGKVKALSGFKPVLLVEDPLAQGVQIILGLLYAYSIQGIDDVCLRIDAPGEETSDKGVENTSRVVLFYYLVNHLFRRQLFLGCLLVYAVPGIVQVGGPLYNPLCNYQIF